MGQFKYSQNEMDVNKVLKMNQDLSNAMLNDTGIESVRKAADSNIDSAIELLSSLGKNGDILHLSTQVLEDSADRKLEHRPVIETWDQIVKQANLLEPHLVELEDIMSPIEIQSAFEELDEINQEFSRKTSIVNKTDLTFLAIATALQVTKSLIFPYVAEKFDYGKSFDSDERLDHNDKSIVKAHRKANDEYKEKKLKKNGTGYWINILYQAPAYDITAGSKELGINMGGKAHRMYTLGHDPVLGWIFGTANILTDTITFNSFHTNRVIRQDPITKKKKMIITPEVVPMGMLFQESYEMAKADKLNLPAAIFAQAQHLKADEFTKMGLPIPLLSSINEDFASKLYKENYDALCLARDVKIVGASFIVSKIIDMIIVLLHGLFRNEEDKDLFEVRTRKILLISNSIASTSTIINTAITKNPKNLDIGSLLNTVTHLFSDLRFIARIKEEFIENEISTRIQTEIKEIDDLFETV